MSKDRWKEREKAKRDVDKKSNGEREGEGEEERRRELQTWSRVHSACPGVEYRFTYPTVIQQVKLGSGQCCFYLTVLRNRVRTD